MVVAQRERRYQLIKVKAGDWLLPSNDREQLWRTLHEAGTNIAYATKELG